MNWRAARMIELYSSYPPERYFASDHLTLEAYLVFPNALEIKRVLNDEGVIRTVYITCNIPFRVVWDGPPEPEPPKELGVVLTASSSVVG